MRVFAINPDYFFLCLLDIFSDRAKKRCLWFHDKKYAAGVVSCEKYVEYDLPENDGGNPIDYVTFYGKNRGYEFRLFTQYYDPRGMMRKSKEEIFARVDNVKDGKRIIIYVIENFDTVLFTLYFSNVENNKFEECLKKLETFSLS